MPPVSTTQGELVAKFAAGVVDTGGKLTAGVVDTTGINNTSETGDKICHQCHLHQWCTLTCEYLREFLKKFEMILMLLSGAWGKVIHEKNLKQKSRDNVPLKVHKIEIFLASILKFVSFL